MFPPKNIPLSRIAPIETHTTFDQLTYFAGAELESLFPRLQNPYLTFAILQILPIDKLCTLRKVSKTYKTVVDWYLSLHSINIVFNRFEYYPKAENINRLRITQGSLHTYSLESILPTAPHVKWLEFNGNSTICQDYLSTYFQYTGNIEILSFNGYYTVKVKTIRDAMVNNPKLRIIDLSLCQNLTRDTIKTLCKTLPNLEAIHLKNCNWVEQLSLVELLIRLSKLKRVSVRACPKITFDTVKTLRQIFPTVWIDY